MTALFLVRFLFLLFPAIGSSSSPDHDHFSPGPVSAEEQEPRSTEGQKKMKQACVARVRRLREEMCVTSSPPPNGEGEDHPRSAAPGGILADLGAENLFGFSSSTMQDEDGRWDDSLGNLYAEGFDAGLVSIMAAARRAVELRDAGRLSEGRGGSVQSRLVGTQLVNGFGTKYRELQAKHARGLDERMGAMARGDEVGLIAVAGARLKWLYDYYLLQGLRDAAANLVDAAERGSSSSRKEQAESSGATKTPHQDDMQSSLWLIKDEDIGAWLEIMRAINLQPGKLLVEIEKIQSLEEERLLREWVEREGTKGQLPQKLTGKTVVSMGVCSTRTPVQLCCECPVRCAGYKLAIVRSLCQLCIYSIFVIVPHRSTSS